MRRKHKKLYPKFTSDIFGKNICKKYNQYKLWEGWELPQPKGHLGLLLLEGGARDEALLSSVGANWYSLLAERLVI